MAAFRLARSYGVPGIEIDVRLSADGVLAVIHDGSTSRVAPNQGPRGGLEVARSSWSRLRTVDVGSWRGEEWRGERIPRLEELFEELGDTVYYDIEIMNPKLSDHGLEAALAAALAAVSRGGIAERSLVSSFNPFALARFKALAPRTPTAIIWSQDRELPFFLRQGEGLWMSGVDAFKPSAAKVGALSAFRWRTIHRRPFIPWTVDEEGEAARLLDLGCEGMISNRPQDLMAGSRAGPSPGR